MLKDQGDFNDVQRITEMLLNLYGPDKNGYILLLKHDCKKCTYSVIKDDKIQVPISMHSIFIYCWSITFFIWLLESICIDFFPDLFPLLFSDLIHNNSYLDKLLRQIHLQDVLLLLVCDLISVYKCIKNLLKIYIKI